MTQKVNDISFEMKSVHEIIAGSGEEYISGGLNEKDIPADPLELFEKWLEEAVERNPELPNAMHLSTAGADGRPSGRIVLLKAFDKRGFVFYTNLDSRKGRELKENNHAALTFFWDELFRQVRLEGRVFEVPPEESDSYFASRPRESKISALASEQSRVLKNRKDLEDRVKELENSLKGKDVQRPANWGGYYLSPSYMEFWQGRAHRLHDRIVYRRKDNSDRWDIMRLYP
ncbi:MAG TPA: pyridoxamine 5'-phosphate oxidase [Bacteroidales bacterium]|jgi:pyridoxamine 5'-phosphate oxidase|nr:pyridoxamine 5'-phosphate oxidase [Bacteroidales bacterium]